MRAAVADGGAWIVDAMRNHRPSVILAFLDDVQLVAAARAMLGFPQAPSRIEGQAFLAAQAIGPDFRKNTRLPQKRIVGRGRAVGRDVNDLTEIGVHALRDVPG